MRLFFTGDTRIKSRLVLDIQSISKNINNRCDTQQKTWAARGGSRGRNTGTRVKWGERQWQIAGRLVKMLFKIQRRSRPSDTDSLPSRAVSALDHPSQPPYLPPCPLAQILVPPRAALVDEFRVCCQSLFRAIISKHFDMTYKPARGREEWLPPSIYWAQWGKQGWGCIREVEKSREERGQWENAGATLVDAGGSIRGERLAMGGGREGGRKRERGVRSLGTYGGSRGDVTHARGTVNAFAIRQTHENPRRPPSNPVSRTHRISPLPPPCTRDPFPPSRARCLSFRPCVSFCRQMHAIRRC